MAICYGGAFFATLFCSGIATFVAISWSADTDKIVLYYGFLNPCVLFDHYPAKVVAMSGMSFFILIGIAYDFVVFLAAYCERRLSGIVWTGLVVWSVTLVHLAFVNVFVTNLYLLPERRLHGVEHDAPGKASLVGGPLYWEEGTVGAALSAEDIKIVELHTAFYVVWLLGELWFLALLAQTRREYILSRPWCTRLFYYGFGFVAVVGISLHALAMMIIILQDRPKVEWYFRETMQSRVQWAFIYLDAKLGTSAWGWAPAMFFRWVFAGGEGAGVRITARRRRRQITDDGGVMPTRWVGRALRTTSFVLAAGGAFSTEWQADTTIAFHLAASLRTKPFAYFGAPVLLASFISVAVGLSLTCLQRRLCLGRMNWALTCTAMLMMFSCFGCLLVVLEQERFTSVFFCCAIVCYFAWVIQVSAPSNTVQASAYCAVGGVVICTALAFNLWVCYYLFLAWLCLYNAVVPDGEWVYLTLEKVGEAGAVYQSVEHSSFESPPAAPPAAPLRTVDGGSAPQVAVEPSDALP